MDRRRTVKYFGRKPIRKLMNKFRTCKHLIFIHVSHVVGFKSRVECGEERLFARIPSNVWVNSGIMHNGVMYNG